MVIQIKINTGFVKDGGRGSVWKNIKLNDEQVNEFKLKRDSLDIDCELEDFIVDDISTLVEHEIENGLYGLFNYWAVDLKLKSLDNKILVRSKNMEILFYVGMIMFGFYCLVTEPIENVERDFGMYGVRNEEDK